MGWRFEVAILMVMCAAVMVGVFWLMQRGILFQWIPIPNFGL